VLRAWTLLQRSALNCASTSKGILCFGGGELNPAYPDAAIFDGKAWKTVARMTEARNWFGATDVASVDTTTGKEYVYAVAGYCCNPVSHCFFSPLTSVERCVALGLHSAPQWMSAVSLLSRIR
jgi:hypothetical protein